MKRRTVSCIVYYLIIFCSSPGCKSRLENAHIFGPLYVCEGQALSTVYVADAKWDYGWGTFGTVSGPRTRIIQHDTQLREGILHRRVRESTPETNVDSIMRTASLLGQSSESMPPRAYYVISITPPILAYISNRNGVEADSPLRGVAFPLVGGEKQDVPVDGYVQCNNKLWDIGSNCRDGTQLKAQIVCDTKIDMPENIYSLMRRIPWNFDVKPLP